MDKIQIDKKVHYDKDLIEKLSEQKSNLEKHQNSVKEKEQIEIETRINSNKKELEIKYNIIMNK